LFTKMSGAYRAIEILLGVVAFAVGLLALFFPAAVVVTLVVFFGIALLIVGILRLATAASSDWLAPTTRKTNSIVGILAIIFGAIILFAPFFATYVLVILIGVGLLIYGVGRIVVGGAGGFLSGGLRALLIVVGILVVAFSLLIIFVPAVGVLTYAFFVSVAFLLIGIDSLVSGIVGAPITV
jgi:uncharacterized membrane protein HdeD (DUF308 family)